MSKGGRALLPTVLAEGAGISDFGVNHSPYTTATRPLRQMGNKPVQPLREQKWGVNL